jgi:hypothetical protein
MNVSRYRAWHHVCMSKSRGSDGLPHPLRRAPDIQPTRGVFVLAASWALRVQVSIPPDMCCEGRQEKADNDRIPPVSVGKEDLTQDDGSGACSNCRYHVESRFTGHCRAPS